MVYTYPAKLSPRQKMWFIVSVVAVLSISTLGIFNLDFDHWLILVTVVVSLALAFFTYRPFCQFVCPLGLTSWIAEKFSLYRVIIDEEKCDGCGYSWPSASRIFDRGARIGILILICCFVAGCVDRPNWKIRPQGHERLLNLLLF